MRDISTRQHFGEDKQLIVAYCVASLDFSVFSASAEVICVNVALPEII